MAVNSFDTILSSALNTDTITYQWTGTSILEPIYKIKQTGEREMSNSLRYTIDIWYTEDDSNEDKLLTVIGLPGKCSFNSEYFVTIHEFIDGEDAWHYIPTYNVKRISCTPIIK